MPVSNSMFKVSLFVLVLVIVLGLYIFLEITRHHNDKKPLPGWILALCFLEFALLIVFFILLYFGTRHYYKQYEESTKPSPEKCGEKSKSTTSTKVEEVK